MEAFDELVSRKGTRSAEQRKEQDHLLGSYDVYFRIRRLFYVSDFLRDLQLRTPDPNYQKLRYMLGRQIELLEILQVAMEKLIDEAAIKWNVEVPLANAGKGLPSGSGPLPEWFDRDGKVKRRLQDPVKVWADVQRTVEELMRMNNPVALHFPTAYEDSSLVEDWRQRDFRDFEKTWLTQKELDAFNTSLGARAEKAKTGIEKDTLPAPQNVPTLLEKTDDFERSIFETLTGNEEMEQIRHAYDTFPHLDAHLYPMELVSQLRSTNVIKTVRISPLDAKKGFSDRQLSEKVAGKALFHFGGFFKRSWRSNDILWGRLDTVCQLSETLLSAERLKTTLGDPSGSQNLKGRMHNGLDPARLFPHAGEATQQELNRLFDLLPPLAAELVKKEKELKKLREVNAGKSQEETKKAADSKQEELQAKYAKFQKTFTDYLELLIEAAQLEVLFEDVPEVITDAIEEQAEWNQFLVSVPKRQEGLADPSALPHYNPKKGGFTPGKGDLDAAVVTVAAEADARMGLKRMTTSDGASAATPARTPLGTFFQRKYKVGSEEIQKDIPWLILLEIISTAALVLRNCVLGSLGDLGKKIEEKRAFTFVVDYPLQAFHSIIQFLRRAPGQWPAILIGSFILSVLALTVGITWWGAIIHPVTGQFAFHWFAVFIFVPGLILLAQGIFWWGGKPQKRTKGRIWSVVVLALAAFFGLFSVVACFAGSYEWVRGGVASWAESIVHISLLARAIAWASVAMLYVGLPLAMPLAVTWWFAWVGERRSKVKPAELQRALQSYFAGDDLLLLARRLSLPSALETIAKKITGETEKGNKWDNLRSVVTAVKPALQPNLPKKDDQSAWQDLLKSKDERDKEKKLTADELIQVGGRLSIMVEFSVPPDRTRAKLADEIFAEAEKANALFDLEKEMRAVNPDALA